MDFNRREFVFAGAAAAAAWARLDPFAPIASASAEAAAPVSGAIDVGTAADFGHDGAFEQFARSRKLMLVRKGERLYATSAVCTHRDCVIKPVQGEMRCPCHGSRFDLAGGVTKGPAKSPLSRFAIWTDANGRIVVDPSQKFGSGQWDDPKSFVTVK